MERKHTFASIALAAGVTPRTVKSWWNKAKTEHGELGEILAVGDSRKFSKDEHAILLGFASDRAIAEGPKKVVVEHDEREHHVELGLTSSAVNLGAFRGERILQKLDDPIGFVASLDSFLSEIETHMDIAERKQEEDLLTIKRVKYQAEKKVEKMRIRSERYRIKTDIMTALNNAELSQLRDIANDVNNMGKGLGDSVEETMS